MEIKHYKISPRVSSKQLNSEIDEIWLEIQDENSPLRKQAEDLGIDVSAIAGKQREEFLTIEREGMGIAVETTAIIVAFAPVVAKITKDLWDHVILPQIIKSFGSDAITKQKKE